VASHSTGQQFFGQGILNIAYLLIFEECFILAGFADDHA